MFTTSTICTVTISDEDGKLTGTVKRASERKKFEFDPLTALCDLLDTSVYDENKGRLPKTHVNHPFFMGREYEGDPEAIKIRRFSMMLYALSNLKDIIVDKKILFMSELEVIKLVFELKFSCKVEFRQEDPLYDWGYKVNPFNNKMVERYVYTTPDYIFDFDMEKLFAEYKDNIHIFSYTCYDVKDIIFSVMHYLVLLKYRFNKCNHCGRYFATKTLKTNYCNRKSPYKGYGKFGSFENIDCEQAVRNIRQEIRREKNRIDDYICALDRHDNTKNSFKFGDICKTYDKKIGKHYTVENLKGYEILLIDCRERAGMNKGRVKASHSAKD